MQAVLDSLLGLPAPVVVVLAFLILAGEPALLPGILLPSVSTALGLGFLVDGGTINLPTALVTAVVAVVAGDVCAYVVGRRGTGGRRRSGLVQRRLDGAVNRASALIARHGGRSVFFARWVVGARTLVPRLAGAGRMPPGTFLRHSVPAGVLWSVCWVGAGQLAGSSYRQVSAVAGQATLGFVVAVVAVVAGVVAGRRLGRLAGTSTVRLVAALAAIGGALTALVVVAVRAGGLPRVDEPVAAALDSLSWGGLDLAVRVVLTSTPSYTVIAIAAVVVLLRPVRSPRRRGALGLLASGGAVVPLMMLVVVLNVAETVAHSERLFAIQHATSTTAIVLAAWTVARKQHTRLGQGSAWTLGAAAVVVLAAGRIYLGWGSVSSTVAALLIGVAWAGVFAAAWAATPGTQATVRDRKGSGRQTAGSPEHAAAEHGYRASPVNQAVVQLEKGLDLGPVVARRSWLGAGSTVKFEHDGYLLALPAPTAPDGRFAIPTG
ncbi:DedA family protein [Cryptosporangium arvum]|uniref:DedA family protein n=1 Tax=Cryptosporangium arvum TaxID=80871 RepID=UPI0004BB5D81|nr:VTT domain-containing protein [Cryptosporangium arvum]